MTNPARSALLIGLIAVVMAGCGSPAPGAIAPAGEALVVNGTPVPTRLFNTLVKSQQQRLESQGAHADWNSAEGKRQLNAIDGGAIRTLAFDAIIAHLSQAKNVSVTDAEVTSALSQVEQAVGGAPAFDAQLGRAGISRADFATLFRYRLLDQKLRQAEGTAYAAAIKRAVDTAKVQAFVGPCQSDHQYPRCVGGG